MSDAMPIAASAPGKVILSGEYAVLDGAPAVCMAVDRRARVTVEFNDEDHHVVTAPGYADSTTRFKVVDGVVEWLEGGEGFKLVEDLWRAANVHTTRHFSIRLDTIDFIDAEKALAIGLVGQVAAADTFEQSFLAYCQKIAEVAPLAARQTKLQVARVGLPDDLEALIRDELRYTGRGLKSDDGKEAVRAIFEKRKPIFSGT